MNWKLRKAFTGNNTSDVQTINGYIAEGEDNDFSVEVSPVGKEYPAPLVVPRTNLVKFSENLESGSFGKTRCTIEDNFITSPEGVINASKMTSTDALESYIQQDITTIGTKLAWSFFAKKGDLDYAHGLLWDTSANGCRQWFNLSTGAVGGTTTFGSGYSVDYATIEDYGDGWYRCAMVVNTTAGPQGCRVSISSANTTITSPVNSYGYFYGLQLEEGDKTTEYIPTTTEVVTRSWDSFSRVQNQVPGICNGTHTHTGAASGGGIAATTLTGTGSGGKFKYEFDTLGKLTLIEAMTHENLLLQSNTFDTTWTTINASVTSGESGYDGSSDAWLLGSTGGSNGRVVQSISQGGVQTLSFYAKAGTYNFARPLGLDSSTNPDAFFDLSTGTIASVDPACDDAQMQDVGGGWYRCSITYNTTISEARIYPAFADGDTSTFGGNIYIQDAQLESGSQATGYIETTTAPVREGAGQGYRVDDKLSIITNEGHDIEFRLVEGSNATTVTVGMEATKPSKPVPFPVTKMRVADSTDRRVLIMDQRSRYVFPKPTPYLLDTYEGAAAAYSLRRLRSAYTGPAVRVRRESNNDELDIYFDGQGNLDTASLEAFCAGTNGFVKVWYDQSPGGNDTEQTNTSLQPKICDSSTGVILDEDNNLPAALFAGDYLNSGTLSATGTATNFAVANISGGSVTRALFFTPECFVFFTVEWRILSSSTQTVYAGNEQGLNLHYFGADNAGDFAAINGGTLTTSANVAAANTKIAIGTQSTNIVPFYGYVQECIYYNSDQSSNRTGIETNINDFYNIY